MCFDVTACKQGTLGQALQHRRLRAMTSKHIQHLWGASGTAPVCTQRWSWLRLSKSSRSSASPVLKLARSLSLASSPDLARTMACTRPSALRSTCYQVPGSSPHISCTNANPANADNDPTGILTETLSVGYMILSCVNQGRVLVPGHAGCA